jgi:hypothetical protein
LETTIANAQQNKISEFLWKLVEERFIKPQSSEYNRVGISLRAENPAEYISQGIYIFPKRIRSSLEKGALASLRL